MKRIGLIGDVHAEDERLRFALEFLRDEVDKIFCVGDIADGEGDIDACCDMLRDASAEVVTGNHDRWLLEGSMRIVSNAHFLNKLAPRNQAWVRTLPKTRVFDTPLGKAMLCHGIAENDMAKVMRDDSGYALESNDALQNLLNERIIKILLNGHSHEMMVRKISHLTIINAGTLKRSNEPCFVVVDLVQRTVTRYDFGAGVALAGETSYPF